jgi:hypothetical protein
LSSNTVKNEQAVRQLREIVTQIQSLGAFGSSPNKDNKITITSLPVVPQLNQQRVDANRQIANEPSHQAMILGTVGDPIWQQATGDGTIKYAASGLIPTGLSNRAVIFAVYREPIKGLSCVKAVYADDGTAVVDPFVSGSCEKMPVDWVKGTTAGIIRHFPTIGKCQELTWSPTKLAFEDSTVACEP